MSHPFPDATGSNKGAGDVHLNGELLTNQLIIATVSQIACWLEQKCASVVEEIQDSVRAMREETNHVGYISLENIHEKLESLLLTEQCVAGIYKQELEGSTKRTYLLETCKAGLNSCNPFHRRNYSSPKQISDLLSNKNCSDQTSVSSLTSLFDAYKTSEKLTKSEPNCQDKTTDKRNNKGSIGLLTENREILETPVLEKAQSVGNKRFIQPAKFVSHKPASSAYSSGIPLQHTSFHKTSPNFPFSAAQEQYTYQSPKGFEHDVRSRFMHTVRDPTPSQDAVIHHTPPNRNNASFMRGPPPNYSQRFLHSNDPHTRNQLLQNNNQGSARSFPTSYRPQPRFFQPNLGRFHAPTTEIIESPVYQQNNMIVDQGERIDVGYSTDLSPNKSPEGSETVDDTTNQTPNLSCPVNNSARDFDKPSEVAVKTDFASEDTEKVPEQTYRKAVADIYRCRYCKENFVRNKRKFKNHLLEKHNEADPFICLVCSKTFRRIECLNRHWIEHVGVGPFLCKVCDKVYLSTNHKKNHERKEAERLTDLDDRSTDEMSCKSIIKQCSICGKYFPSVEEFKKHMLVHSNTSKSYQGKVVNRLTKSYLKENMGVQGGDKPYSCDICGKTFFGKRLLKTHLMIHSIKNEKSNE